MRLRGASGMTRPRASDGSSTQVTRAETSAVRAFPVQRRLKVTGVLDQETREALNEAVNQLAPADRSYVLTP